MPLSPHIAPPPFPPLPREVAISRNRFVVEGKGDDSWQIFHYTLKGIFLSTRLRETRAGARYSQEAGFTQPLRYKFALQYEEEGGFTKLDSPETEG